MKRIIFATGNPGKLREIKAILGDLGMEIVTMKEAGINVEIIEDGKTFAENAVIKVNTILGALPEGDESIVMADDSGLEVDAMDKAPGVYSARWMGEDTSYRVKNMKIVELLEGVPVEKRTARFVCTIAAGQKGKEVLVSTGVIEGKIGYEERGEGGFGYDPIFYLPDMSRTTAELTAEEKNAISHRGNALREMKKLLEKNL
ncbi:MAG: RdgB/HAM1 family non-canonical purine NTP pyrophosphatase [Lachnospiraceae bacterium]|nr:RdgB/HAM1 family non-canonical purine NTP pyrophosphatase [Lachnospiraceae bacterium]